MIVVDASVVIALLSPRDAHHDKAAQFVVSHSEFRLHPVTMAEVLIGPARQSKQEETLDHLRALGFSVDTPDSRDPVRAAMLRAETGLKLPDCYVLGAALSLGRPLATFDRRLADSAQRRQVELVDFAQPSAST